MWTEITSNLGMAWKPNIGDVVEGVLVQIKQNVGKNNSVVYSLQTSNGLIDIWSSTVIDQKLTQTSVGSLIRIEYLGEKTNPKTGRIFKDFKIWRDV